MEATTKRGNPHARFYGVLSHIPGATKQDLVYQYSNRQTTSLAEFLQKNAIGYWDMVRDLESKFRPVERWIPPAPPTPVASVKTDSAVIKQKRSAILHRLQKYGVDTTNWDKVNAFLEQPKIAGKRLYEMNLTEMSALIPKLESILKKIPPPHRKEQ